MIIFITVKDTAAKIAALCKIAQRHFTNKEPLFFLAADAAAVQFLDKLLWSTPVENFLPHPTYLLSIGIESKKDFSSIFNLTPSPIQTTATIYEFEDHTSPVKLQLSKQRYQTYRDQNIPITIEI